MFRSPMHCQGSSAGASDFDSSYEENKDVLGLKSPDSAFKFRIIAGDPFDKLRATEGLRMTDYENSQHCSACCLCSKRTFTPVITSASPMRPT